MKKSMSLFSVVLIHVTHGAIIFPFFGLLINYFLLHHLNITQNPTITMLIKDFILIFSVYLGTKCSLAYIDKNIHINDVKKFIRYSLFIFASLVLAGLITSTMKLTNTNALMYNLLFYVILYMVFYVQTKKLEIEKFIFS